jgi:hypothetical protein
MTVAVPPKGGLGMLTREALVEGGLRSPFDEAKRF